MCTWELTMTWNDFLFYPLHILTHQKIQYLDDNKKVLANNFAPESYWHGFW